MKYKTDSDKYSELPKKSLVQYDFDVTNASICKTSLDFLNSSQSDSTLANPHMDLQTEPWMALFLDFHPQSTLNATGIFNLQTYHEIQ